jgi:hypothetical protein
VNRPATKVAKFTNGKAKKLGLQHLPSGRGCGQRTSMRETHNQTREWWVACIAQLRSWWKDHFSFSVEDPAYQSFEQFSSWPDRCDATRWVMYLGSPQNNELCRPVGLAPWKELGSWLDEAQSGPREDYRGAFRDIYGDSPFSQPPMKVIELWYQVTDKQRHHTGRGYNGCVVSVEGQVNVVRGSRHDVYMQTEESRGDQSTLRHTNPHAATIWCARLEGRLKRPTPKERWDCMD